MVSHKINRFHWVVKLLCYWDHLLTFKSICFDLCECVDMNFVHQNLSVWSPSFRRITYPIAETRPTILNKPKIAKNRKKNQLDTYTRVIKETKYVKISLASLGIILLFYKSISSLLLKIQYILNGSHNI